MDRRDFLQAGALGAAVAGAGAGGCVSLGEGFPIVPTSMLTQGEMVKLLAKLDETLDAVASKEPLAMMALSKKLGIDARRLPAKEVEEARALVKKSIRSLMVVGALHDLPEEGRVHPGVQARLWGHMNEMNEAVSGMRSYMASLPSERRAAIGDVMKRENTGMLVLEALDEDAARFGVVPSRRSHMRSIGTHVSFRMRQSTPLLFDACVRTVDKAFDRAPKTIEEAEEQLAAKLGQERFASLRAQTLSHVERWQNLGAYDDVPLRDRGERDAVARLAKPDPRLLALNDKGKTILIAGGIVLGLALAFGAVGGILLAVAGGLEGAGVAGAVLLTVGGLHLIAGIITMIVGGVIGSR